MPPLGLPFPDGALSTCPADDTKRYRHYHYRTCAGWRWICTRLEILQHYLPDRRRHWHIKIIHRHVVSVKSLGSSTANSKAGFPTFKDPLQYQHTSKVFTCLPTLNHTMIFCKSFLFSLVSYSQGFATVASAICGKALWHVVTEDIFQKDGLS